ncbi:hypothetical protein HMI54_003597 [Coelomomyces lativittatus]|nr:hypothetical protein HMI54_003597 [Coelomomyces lativittatus]KAJ1508593.1 hypothetical protein HMI56_007212 [Coelomomyces lativittatus]
MEYLLNRSVHFPVYILLLLLVISLFYFMFKSKTVHKLFFKNSLKYNSFISPISGTYNSASITSNPQEIIRVRAVTNVDPSNFSIFYSNPNSTFSTYLDCTNPVYFSNACLTHLAKTNNTPKLFMNTTKKNHSHPIDQELHSQTFQSYSLTKQKKLPHTQAHSNKISRPMSTILSSTPKKIYSISANATTTTPPDSTFTYTSSYDSNSNSKSNFNTISTHLTNFFTPSLYFRFQASFCQLIGFMVRKIVFLLWFFIYHPLYVTLYTLSVFSNSICRQISHWRSNIFDVARNPPLIYASFSLSFTSIPTTVGSEFLPLSSNLKNLKVHSQSSTYDPTDPAEVASSILLPSPLSPTLDFKTELTVPSSKYLKTPAEKEKNSTLATKKENFSVYHKDNPASTSTIFSSTISTTSAVKPEKSPTHQNKRRSSHDTSKLSAFNTCSSSSLMVFFSTTASLKDSSVVQTKPYSSSPIFCSQGKSKNQPPKLTNSNKSDSGHLVPFPKKAKKKKSLKSTLVSSPTSKVEAEAEFSHSSFNSEEARSWPTIKKEDNPTSNTRSSKLNSNASSPLPLKGNKKQHTPVKEKKKEYVLPSNSTRLAVVPSPPPSPKASNSNLSKVAILPHAPSTVLFSCEQEKEKSEDLNLASKTSNIAFQEHVEPSESLFRPNLTISNKYLKDFIQVPCSELQTPHSDLHEDKKAEDHKNNVSSSLSMHLRSTNLIIGACPSAPSSNTLSVPLTSPSPSPSKKNSYPTLDSTDAQTAHSSHATKIILTTPTTPTKTVSIEPDPMNCTTSKNISISPPAILVDLEKNELKDTLNNKTNPHSVSPLFPALNAKPFFPGQFSSTHFNSNSIESVSCQPHSPFRASKSIPSFQPNNNWKAFRRTSAPQFSTVPLDKPQPKTFFLIPSCMVNPQDKIISPPPPYSLSKFTNSMVNEDIHSFPRFSTGAMGTTNTTTTSMRYGHAATCISIECRTLLVESSEKSIESYSSNLPLFTPNPAFINSSPVTPTLSSSIPTLMSTTRSKRVVRTRYIHPPLPMPMVSSSLTTSPTSTSFPPYYGGSVSNFSAPFMPPTSNSIPTATTTTNSSSSSTTATPWTPFSGLKLDLPVPFSPTPPPSLPLSLPKYSDPCDFAFPSPIPSMHPELKFQKSDNELRRRSMVMPRKTCIPTMDV